MPVRDFQPQMDDGATSVEAAAAQLTPDRRGIDVRLANAGTPGLV